MSLPDKSKSVNTITEFLKILYEPECVFEIRTPKTADRAGATFFYTLSGYFNDISAAASAISELDAQHRTPGIYCTLNPVDPALIARANNRIIRSQTTTSDRDIVTRRWMLIDVDPQRSAGMMRS